MLASVINLQANYFTRYGMFVHTYARTMNFENLIIPCVYLALASRSEIVFKP